MIDKIVPNYNCFLLIAIILISTGCTFPKTQVTPEGKLDIFRSSLSPKNPLLNSEWLLDTGKQNNFFHEFAQTVGQVKNLKLNLLNQKDPYILIKRIDANLLATPFLSWNWRIPIFESLDHPVCILVGFYGGQSNSKFWNDKFIAYSHAGYPTYDRVLKIIWHRNALLRGTLRFNDQIPEYVARGGLENVDMWHLENINLASIYRKIWPNDSMENTHIVFLGFWVRGSKSYRKKEIISSFSNIVLSK